MNQGSASSVLAGRLNCHIELLRPKADLQLSRASILQLTENLKCDIAFRMPNAPFLLYTGGILGACYPDSIPASTTGEKDNPRPFSPPGRNVQLSYCSHWLLLQCSHHDNALSRIHYLSIQCLRYQDDADSCGECPRSRYPFPFPQT